MTISLANEDKITLQTSFDVFQIMDMILKRESRINCSTKEYFWVISLNQHKKILNIELVGVGSIKRVAANPPEVYSLPVHKKATSIVMVHNHPSGSLLPSQGDKDVTNKLIQAGLLLDIEVHDHLILVDNTYYSFRDSGLLRELELDDKFALTFTREKLIKRDIQRKLKEVEKAKQQIKEEGIKEGEARGAKREREEHKKEKIVLIQRLIKKGKMTLREISQVIDMPYNWVARIDKEIKRGESGLTEGKKIFKPEINPKETNRDNLDKEFAEPSRNSSLHTKASEEDEKRSTQYEKALKIKSSFEEAMEVLSGKE